MVLGLVVSLVLRLGLDLSQRLVLGLALGLVLVFELGLAWHLVLGLVLLSLVLRLLDDDYDNEMPEYDDSQPYVTPNLESQRVDPGNIIHPYRRTRCQSKSQSQGEASARSHSSNDSITLMDSDFFNRSSFNNYSTNTSPSGSTLRSRNVEYHASPRSPSTTSPELIPQFKLHDFLDSQLCQIY